MMWCLIDVEGFCLKSEGMIMSYMRKCIGLHSTVQENVTDTVTGL